MEVDCPSSVKGVPVRRRAVWEWIVFGVVGVLVAGTYFFLVVPAGGSHRPAPRARAQADMMGFEMALQEYHSIYGRYPTTSEGLEALTVGKQPFLMGPVRKDPWGNAYRYVSPAGGGKGYSLSSDGADGVAGTGDDVVGR